MKVSAVIRELVAAGLNAAAIADAIERIEDASVPSRSTGAERQARYRARKEAEPVTSDVSDVTGDAKTESFPQTPFKEKNIPPSPPTGALSPKRGTRLPVDWIVSTKLRAWTLAEGVQTDRISVEEAKFRDYWHARAGPNAVKVDWNATWRNWVRKVIDDGKQGTGNSRKRSPHERAMAGFAAGADSR